MSAADWLRAMFWIGEDNEKSRIVRDLEKAKAELHEVVKTREWSVAQEAMLVNRVARLERELDDLTDQPKPLVPAAWPRAAADGAAQHPGAQPARSR